MIELRDIHKYFGSVKALQGVSLKVEAGSIHGVVGENGAGKSTLMKVLTGYIARTSGSLLFSGKEVEIQTPRDGTSLGIGMLYQEPLDFLQLSVLDNFMAGAADFQRKKMKKKLLALANRFGFTLHPDSPLYWLTVGERQQLELLRLIHANIRVLILDEPTTGISGEQQDLLFGALRSLKEEGCAIILVSHKLAEIEALCDRLTILRRGKTVAEQEQPFDRNSVLTAMFGEFSDQPPPDQNSTVITAGKKKKLVSFHEVCSSTGRSGLDAVSTDLYEGEVVGLAGLDGSGQSVFLKICADLLPHTGSVERFNHQHSTSSDQGDKQAVFLPADRLSEGLIASLSIREHLLLADNTPLFMLPATGREEAQQAIETYNILGQPGTAAGDLSGGNQQRLLLSLIPAKARLILMENPTRGLDVRSGNWTWHHLREQLPEDGAIIFASPDLEEIMEQASRVIVFFDGRIILDRPVDETDLDEISRAITGQVNSECQIEK